MKNKENVLSGTEQRFVELPARACVPVCVGVWVCGCMPSKLH